MKPRHSPPRIPAGSWQTPAFVAALHLLVPGAPAATRIKADNTAALNLASSWDTLPGPADIALWDATVTAANTTLLGADLSWAGIKLGSPGGPVTLSTGHTLTIGTSGIDLSIATQNLTIASGLTVQGRQTWSAAPGRTLNLTGTFTRNGATVNFSNFNATLGSLANAGSTGILGPWAVTGSTTALQYVTSTGGAISAYSGAIAATAADLSNLSSAATNYSYAAAATLTSDQSGNTLRYTGAASTTALGTFGLTLNGLMNAGTGGLTITSTAGNPGLVTGASGELDIMSNAQTLTLATRITGEGKVVYNAAGNITFGAAANSVGATNNYTGGTVINGTTEFRTVGAGSFFGTGPVTVNGGLMFISNNTLSNDFTFNGGLPTMNNSFASTLSGTITLAVTTTWQLNSNGNMVISGQVTGPGGLTKTQGTNNGPLQLTNANNDYAGPTTVSAGILQVKSSIYGNDMAKWTPANISVASGATFALNTGGAADFSTADAGTLLTNLLTSVNDNGFRSGSLMGLSTANATETVTFATNLTDSTGTGGGSVGLRKSGAGTLELTGANTYTGPTRIDAGTLSINNIKNASAADSALGAGNAVISIGHIASSGTLLYTGVGHTTDRTIQIGTNSAAGPVAGDVGGATIRNDGAGALIFSGANFNTPTNAATGTSPARTLTLSGSNVDANTISGIIQNNQIAGASAATVALNKSGTGLWVLSGANTYTGVTTAADGVLLLDNSEALPGTSHLNFNGGVIGLRAGDFTRSLNTAATPTAATFTGNGGWAAYGADRVVNLGGAADPIPWDTASTGLNNKILILSHPTATHTVNFQNPLSMALAVRTVQVHDGAAAIDARLNGVLTGTTGGLNKTGFGTLALTAPNTYEGTTTLFDGSLLVNNTTGSGTGTSTVNVSTGTLGGNGFISGEVTVGDTSGTADAILAPGPGIDSIDTGNLTFNSDGSYACELNGVAALFDSTIVSGTVTINSGAILGVALTGSLPASRRFFIISNDGADAVSGTFSDLAQDAVVGIFGGTNLKISYTGDTSTGALTGGNDVVLYTEASLATPYSTWAAGTFANTFTNPLPAVDFDKDGLGNLLEFVLGGDPTISQPDIAPAVSTLGGNLVMTFKRSDASGLAPAVTVKVELSTDLSFTSPTDDITIGPATVAGPIAPSGASYTVSNSGGFDTIILTIPRGATPKKFARLKAVTTP